MAPKASDNPRHEQPTIIVVFGAGGDLTSRKITPALFRLFVRNRLSDRFAMIGVDRKEMADEEFRHHLHDTTLGFCGKVAFDEARWSDFARRLTYIRADFADTSSYNSIADRLAAQEKNWGESANRIFYMAIPPSMIETVVSQLGQAGLAGEDGATRIVAEKPFGRDLDSARRLNRILTSIFREYQIYRIDHYLGKETVQNILAFRFANALFEPIWDRRYIDHVDRKSVV